MSRLTGTSAQLCVGRPKMKALIGTVLGPFDVISIAYATATNVYFRARCRVCKKKCVRAYSNMTRVISCGCWRHTKHGGSTHREYKVWSQMKQRCHNPNNAAYASYGGRGIVVCKEWHEYENFIFDMGR